MEHASATANRPAQLAGGCVAGCERRLLVWAAALMLVAAGGVAYHNSLAGPFVFDDLLAIRDNTTIRRLWPIWPALSPPGQGCAVQGRPVANVTLAISYAIDGLNVRGYHLFNVAVHALAGLALFGVVRRTLLLPRFAAGAGSAAAGLAFAISLLWLVHPLTSEAVACAAHRTELLMALFYLLTVYCVIRSARPAGSPPGSPRVGGWLWPVAAVVSCALAMGSKETAVSIPLTVLLYDDLFLAGSIRAALRRRWGLYLGLAASWALLAALVVGGGGRGGTAGVGYGITVWEYARTQFGAVVHYLRLAFWPDALVLDYGTIPVDCFQEIAPYAAAVAGLVAGTLWAMWRRSWAGFLGAVFFAALAPTSSVVPIATQIMAERRMYLPLAALVALVVLAAWLVWRRVGPAGPRLVTIGLPLAVLLLAAVPLTARTIARNADYRDEISLWRSNTRNCPGNARGFGSLGVAYYQAGRGSEAIHEFTRAIEANPRDGDAYNNRGNTCREMGELAAALADLNMAVQLNPANPVYYFNRAKVHIDLKDGASALADLNKSLELDPKLVVALLARSAVHMEAGRLSEAIADAARAIALNPRSGLAFHTRGNGYLLSEQLDKAIADYDQAERLGPAPKTYLRRAQARKGLGDLPGAIADLTRAIEMDPRCVEAIRDRAIAFYEAGRFNEARADVEACRRLNVPLDSDFVRKVEAAIRERKPSGRGRPPLTSPD